MGEVSQCPSVSRSLRGGLLLYVAATDGQGPDRLIWRKPVPVDDALGYRKDAVEIHRDSWAQQQAVHNGPDLGWKTLFSASRGTRVLQKKNKKRKKKLRQTLMSRICF